MTQPENTPPPSATIEDIQKDWNDLKLRVGQLEAARNILEQDNKSLRFLLERVIEHRQKSHNELILLLAGLVSKLPINDIGVVVSKLMEHNAAVAEISGLLAKGKSDAEMPRPSLLQALDQSKRDLLAAVKPLAEELIRLDTPLDNDVLKTLPKDPETFFSPAVVRASRSYVKGQVPRERVVREFGEESLVLFNDMTTDPKLNPRPKPEEIMLAFKPGFESILAQEASIPAEKKQSLLALHQKIQKSKEPTEQARCQKTVFLKLSFILELLHYYENQNTETPETIFAQRLPAMIEQLASACGRTSLDEGMLLQLEELLAHIPAADHRLMVINNIGKTGAAYRTLKYVLRLRAEKNPLQCQTITNEILPDFIKHLVPAKNPPAVPALAAVLRLIHPDLHRLAVKFVVTSDRSRSKEASEALGCGLAKELGLPDIAEEIKAPAAASISPEEERQLAWDKIKDMITRRNDPAAVAAAMRSRLHEKYDADEIRQSWLMLVEADAISLIRIFCQLPYLPDGRTDPLARAVLETYVSRLVHEKYASTYQRVVNSLKNMYRMKSDSPPLLNFLALVRWVDQEAAARLSHDIGMPAH